MPSLRANLPIVIHAKPVSHTKKDRVVGFHRDPVASVSRPVNPSESWPAYHFEMHARKCAYCHDPYQVHRNHDQLCDVGHRLAQEVARFLYTCDGATYSTLQENNKLVRVEIPAGYVEVAGLLKAIERSLRSRSRKPFVSMDRSYFVAPRTSPPPPQRTRSVKIEHEPKSKSKTPPRPRSGEIVDWPTSQPQPLPKPKRAFTEPNNTVTSKRGSLYEEDLAKQLRNAKHYSVEVREPSPRSSREHRLSGYYR